MIEDRVAFVHTALATQSIAGCRCDMDADAVRAVLGEPAGSRRQGKKTRVLSFKSGVVVYLQAGKVVAVLRDFDPPLELKQLELAPFSPTEKPLELMSGVPLKQLLVGRISLEVFGDHVVSIHLA